MLQRQEKFKQMGEHLPSTPSQYNSALMQEITWAKATSNFFEVSWFSPGFVGIYG